MGKGEETRRAILTTALSLSTQVGLGGLTIGRLAKETGLSKSGLFAHFSSKENLQIAVLELAARRFVETVLIPARSSEDGEPRIRAIFRNWFQWSKASFLPGGCFFMAASREFEDRPGPVRDSICKHERRWLDTLCRMAEAGVEKGHFRADLDGRQLAYDLNAIIFAYHHWSRLLRDDSAEQRAVNSFESTLAAASA